MEQTGRENRREDWRGAGKASKAGGGERGLPGSESKQNQMIHTYGNITMKCLCTSLNFKIIKFNKIAYIFNTLKINVAHQNF